MSAVFDKLNLKDQPEILVLNAPKSFEAEIAALEGVAVKRSLTSVQKITFALAFVSKLSEVEHTSAAVAPKSSGDVVLWFAYPKGTSKKYCCDFNRDTGWASITKIGFDTVRQIAIDEDWSALRFRRVEFIKR